MKILGKLAAAAALAMTTVAAPAVTFTATPAEAAPPWAEDVTYWLGGVPVGGKRYYCDGRVIESGNTTNFEYETWNHWYDC